MPLKKASEIADSVKTRRTADVLCQIDEMMESIEQAVEKMENTFVEVDVPENTVPGVVTKVLETVREAGYRTCLIEYQDSHKEITGRAIRVSIAHLE
jgi:hypothetical protein